MGTRALGWPAPPNSIPCTRLGEKRIEFNEVNPQLAIPGPAVVGALVVASSAANAVKPLRIAALVAVAIHPGHRKVHHRVLDVQAGANAVGKGSTDRRHNRVELRLEGWKVGPVVVLINVWGERGGGRESGVCVSERERARDPQRR